MAPDPGLPPRRGQADGDADIAVARSLADLAVIDSLFQPDVPNTLSGVASLRSGDSMCSLTLK